MSGWVSTNAHLGSFVAVTDVTTAASLCSVFVSVQLTPTTDGTFALQWADPLKKGGWMRLSAISYRMSQGIRKRAQGILGWMKTVVPQTRCRRMERTQAWAYFVPGRAIRCGPGPRRRARRRGERIEPGAGRSNWSRNH